MWLFFISHKSDRKCNSHDNFMKRFYEVSLSQALYLKRRKKIESLITEINFCLKKIIIWILKKQLSLAQFLLHQNLMYALLNYLEVVKRMPLTPPKVDSDTNTGMHHHMAPNRRLENIWKEDMNPADFTVTMGHFILTFFVNCFCPAAVQNYTI